MDKGEPGFKKSRTLWLTYWWSQWLRNSWSGSSNIHWHSELTT